MIGVKPARLMDWSNWFAGRLFIAFATSVSELATIWGAVCIGAVDKTVGNLLGSNLFDVLTLAMANMACVSGAVYMQVSLSGRPARRVAHLASWSSLALLALLALLLLNVAKQNWHRRLAFKPPAIVFDLIGCDTTLTYG